MPEPTKSSHHHGNLKEALIEAGIEMLEVGDPFSLRAVARRVGVSQAAPYRHFDNKESLEAAMAAFGFTALQSLMEAEMTRRADRLQLVDLALVYVDYAVANPALYSLMFAHECGGHLDRIEAAARLFALLERVSAALRPDVPAHGLATAGWAMVHGLASLYLDGKLETSPGEGPQGRVREAFAAMGL